MFYLRLIIVILFVLLSNAPLVAQKDLTQKLSKTRNSKGKVDLLNKISKEFREKGVYDSSVYYAKRAKTLSENLNFEKGMVDAYLNLGTTYRELNQLDKALIHLKLLLNLCERKGDEIGKGDAYDNIGHIYYAKGDTVSALESHLHALKIRKNAGDKYGMGNSCDNIAHIYATRSNYLKTVEYFEISLKAFEEIGDQSRIALSSGNVGSYYHFMGNPNKALKNLYKSLKAYKDTDNQAGEVWIYKLIASVYTNMGDYKEALETHQKSLAISKKSNDSEQIADSYTLVGSTYMLMRNYLEALKYQRMAMNLASRMNDPVRSMISHFYVAEIYRAQGKNKEALEDFGIALEMAFKQKSKQWEAATSDRIGRIHFQLGNFEESKKWFTRGLELNKEMFTMQDLYHNYEMLAKVDSKLGNYKGAYENYLKYSQYRDSLQKNDATKLALQYEFDQRQAETRIAQEKKDVLTSQELRNKKLQRNTAIIGFTLMSLLMVSLLYLFRLRNKKLEAEKQNAALKRREAEAAMETEKFKSRFLANISHEFRTPLTLISGHLEILKQQGNMQDLSRYEEMDKNGKRLLQLINQLLDLSKMESGQYTLQYRRGNILNEIQAHAQAFHSHAQQLGVDLVLHITETAQSRLNETSFYYSSEALATILGNLLSNALKFTPASGKINTAIDFVNDQLFISVADTGPGIPEQHLDKIFDRFYQIDSSSRQFNLGSGIGLALVKELAILHGGDVSVNNMEEGGAIFAVWISSQDAPEQYIASEVNKIHENIEQADRNENHGLVDAGVNVELPLLLVVEDQEQLRRFICECLGDQYRYVEASDGLQGIALAKELLPDLIISDVMMPGANGFELCDQLKNNDATSHIPVILLTAKTDQNDKETGLETGADDYLTKPFSVSELQLRVRNMMRLRQLLRQKFISGNIPLPEEAPELSDRDREFLSKLTLSTENNLANPQFGVASLAETVHLSSSQLTRKLKALTGHTPADFIKHIRLQKALELLKKNNSITDVSWAVGFEDPSYFGKVFKKHFGVPPSEKEKIK